jgi:hypothetical protein
MTLIGVVKIQNVISISFIEGETQRGVRKKHHNQHNLCEHVTSKWLCLINIYSNGSINTGNYTKVEKEDKVDLQMNSSWCYIFSLEGRPEKEQFHMTHFFSIEINCNSRNGPCSKFFNFIYIQLCDKSISRLRRHAKLSGCSLLMFEKL